MSCEPSLHFGLTVPTLVNVFVVVTHAKYVVFVADAPATTTAP